MVTRIDNIDILLHPRQTTQNAQTGLREAVPVVGSWAEWNPETTQSVQHEALAASQGQGPPRRFGEATTFVGISSAADSPRRDEAIWFLRNQECAWHAKSHPCPPFRVDITEGVVAPSQRHFHWPDFVQRRDWHRVHIEDEDMHITAFEVVWSSHGEGDGEAVFLGTRSDGKRFTVNPRAAKEFSWNLDDIEI